jgi:hypothetical protein
MEQARGFSAVALRRDVLEGAGEIVGRILPQGRVGLEPLDPFLLLDHFRMRAGGPGFPEHPHRGFEILTLTLKGWGRHRDNFGNDAEIGEGGLMRLTSGRGMRHSESVGSSDGGDAEGLQFWVNLPKALKGLAPSFQKVEARDFPVESLAGSKGSATILVGPGSPVEVRTPMEYLKVVLEKGGKWRRGVPEGWNGFVYVLEGRARSEGDGKVLAAGEAGVLGKGDCVEIANAGEERLELLAAWGRPHGEPVLWNGPFVD